MRTRPAIGVISAVVLGGGFLLAPQPADAQLSSGSAQSSGVSVQAPSAVRVARHLGGPGIWTKISTGLGAASNEPGLLRTKDGNLHVVWVRNNADNDNSLGYSTISKTGKLTVTGIAVDHWFALQNTPRLVPAGADIRLVFNGRQNTAFNNPLGVGSRYTATSSNGTSWTLGAGSLSSNKGFNQTLAASTESDGTPITSEGIYTKLFFHVGIDASTPAAIADGEIDGPAGTTLENAALARDKDGSVWAAWFQELGTNQSYYVKRVWPSPPLPAVRVPGSGRLTWGDNEPAQQVAFAPRVGGGLYLAYCQATSVKACDHVALWKVGAAKATAVPGSSGGHASHVTLSAAPGGRLVVGWYDGTKSLIDVVRTNAKATAYGALRTVKLPSKTLALDGLFSESSSGRIDLIANLQHDSTGRPVAFWQTQVFAGLKVTATPRSVSHTHTTTVTFKVTDAGAAVAGATVSFLGHTAHTNSKGIAKITVAKGQKKGTKTATVSKTLYYKGTVSVKIT
jgi:hypothetical protein